MSITACHDDFVELPNNALEVISAERLSSYEPSGLTRIYANDSTADEWSTSTMTTRTYIAPDDAALEAAAHALWDAAVADGWTPVNYDEDAAPDAPSPTFAWQVPEHTWGQEFTKGDLTLSVDAYTSAWVDEIQDAMSDRALQMSVRIETDSPRPDLTLATEPAP